MIDSVLVHEMTQRTNLVYLAYFLPNHMKRPENAIFACSSKGCNIALVGPFAVLNGLEISVAWLLIACSGSSL